MLKSPLGAADASFSALNLAMYSKLGVKLPLEQITDPATTSPILPISCSSNGWKNEEIETYLDKWIASYFSITFSN